MRLIFNFVPSPAGDDIASWGMHNHRMCACVSSVVCSPVNVPALPQEPSLKPKALFRMHKRVFRRSCKCVANIVNVSARTRTCLANHDAPLVLVADRYRRRPGARQTQLKVAAHRAMTHSVEERRRRAVKARAELIEEEKLRAQASTAKTLRCTHASKLEKNAPLRLWQ